MLVTRPTTALVVRDAVFTTEEETALVGFLAGYSGLTRDAYALDLRQYVGWCAERQVTLFGARRADIESFGRQLEALGRARATIARRLCTITCFYRYAEQEGLIPTSPGVHVRRPRLDYESHATGLDRNEVGHVCHGRARRRPRPRAHLVARAERPARSRKRLGPTSSVSASNAAIAPSGLSARAARSSRFRSHPGPPAPSTSRSANVTKDRSFAVPITATSIATRQAGSCIVSPAEPGSPNASVPTPCGTPSSPPRSTPGFHSATSKKRPATPTRGPPCATTAPASPSTDTPPTSSQPSSPEQPDKRPIPTALGVA